MQGYYDNKSQQGDSIEYCFFCDIIFLGRIQTKTFDTYTVWGGGGGGAVIKRKSYVMQCPGVMCTM